MNPIIRQEQVQEYVTTENVIKLAFENMEFSDKKEHFLVDRLRKSDAFVPSLSLVAITEENNIVGHILLTKIKIKNDEQVTDSLALAPVSVLPAYQNKGVGTLLINNALLRAKEEGFTSVVVLGHPNYYPKFGFKTASLWGIRAPFEIPDELFMALELEENALKGVSGVVSYAKEFF